MNQSRRSFCLAAAAAPLFLSQNLNAKDTRNDEIMPNLPNWPLSPAGKKFQLQMFGELLHFQLLSPPQITSGWSEVAQGLLRNVALNHWNPLNARKKIASYLNLDASEMDQLRDAPQTVWTPVEWRKQTAEITGKDATAIYILGSKVHHVEALLSLARSPHIDAIAKYKMDSAPAQKPGEKCYDIRGALGLYADPESEYGLGGSGADQIRAREFLFMVRNHGPLIEPQSAARLLRASYAAPLVQEIVDNTLVRAKLHVPRLDRSKYGEAIGILQHAFPNEISDARMRQAQFAVLGESANAPRKPGVIKNPPINAFDNTPGEQAINR